MTNTASMMVAASLLMLHIANASGNAGTTSDFNNLGRQIDRIRVENNVPGAVMVIVEQDGPVFSAGFGLADRKSRTPATPDTVFRIGSISKIFTAAALVQLSRLNGFDLQDDVTAHVSTSLFFNRWQREHAITVAHLLEHTSGFRDWTKAEFDHDDESPASLEQGLMFSPESRTAHWKPGLHPVYSNSNYGLAGLVLEHVSGRKYEDVLHEHLFVPLDMQSASSLRTRTTGLATGYRQDGASAIKYWNMIQRPAAAINATPREMAALITMLLDNGKYNGIEVLTPSEVARMETPTTSLSARNGLEFGYGLGMYGYYRNGFAFQGHSGDGDGFLSRFAYCRELGIGYFITINSANYDALGQMYKAIEEEITRDHQAPEAPVKATLDKQLLERYSGQYELAAWRFDWTSAASIARRSVNIMPDEDGNLRIEYHDGGYGTLIPVTGREFRRHYENEATSGFYVDEGDLYFQEGDSWIKVGKSSNAISKN